MYVAPFFIFISGSLAPVTGGKWAWPRDRSTLARSQVRGVILDTRGDFRTAAWNRRRLAQTPGFGVEI